MDLIDNNIIEFECHRKLSNSGRQLITSNKIGLDSLPYQFVNSAVSKGIFFNILCIGECGIGKSTLIQSLFKIPLNEDENNNSPKVDVSTRKKLYELTENGVKLKLTLVETVGFGDQIDKTESMNSVIAYIDDQFDAYLNEEMKIKREMDRYQDTRIHLCIYFLPPTGTILKSLDLVCMKLIQNKVNIIPIIAKADAITQSEMISFRALIKNELKQNGVMIYQFPTFDPFVNEENKILNELMPLAVFGSQIEEIIDGFSSRVRRYPWGLAIVNNENHCDFMKLREAILCNNMEDLIISTHHKHYELFRKKKLELTVFKGKNKSCSSLRDTYKSRQDEIIQMYAAKEEQLRNQFTCVLKKKEAELKKSEDEMNCNFKQIKENLLKEKRDIESILAGLNAPYGNKKQEK